MPSLSVWAGWYLFPAHFQCTYLQSPDFFTGTVAGQTVRHISGDSESTRYLTEDISNVYPSHISANGLRRFTNSTCWFAYSLGVDMNFLQCSVSSWLAASADYICLLKTVMRTVISSDSSLETVFVGMWMYSSIRPRTLCLSFFVVLLTREGQVYKSYW